jgi:hypothetical protein
VQCLFICVCAGTISLEIFQPSSTVIQRRDGRLPDSYIYCILYLYIFIQRIYLYTVQNVEAYLWKYILIDTNPHQIHALPEQDQEVAT